MAFFTTQVLGRIYVIKMVLPDGTIVHKIGICNSSRSVDRMLEILRSWFMKFRFIPYTELRMDLECPDPQKLEKHIHEVLAEKQFIPNHKVEGGTEMFVELDEQRVIHYLRAYVKSMYTEPPSLDDEGRRVLCQLLTR